MKITNDAITNFLVISILAVGGLMFISGIGLFVKWIYHSWINRNNSMNYTGRDITEKLFKKNGINHEIKSSFFYAKYWNHNKKKNTYKLRPWTHNRRSIWTMMEASQQAYATIIRETNKKTFWLAFRLPQFVSIASIVLGFALIGWGIYDVTSTNDLLRLKSSVNAKVYAKVIIGLLVFITGFAYAIVARAYILRKNVPKMLEGTGLSTLEIAAIKSIFNWALIYSISLAIMETLKTILRIILEVSDSSIF